MKKKRLLSILCLSLVLTLTVSCGTGGGTDTDTEGNTATTSNDLAATNTGSGADGHVDLHFITRPMGSGYSDNMVKDMLEEKFNCTINWELGPGGSDDYEEFCVTLLASGDYPDMMEVWSAVHNTSLIPAMAADGEILPLDDLLNQYGQNILEDRPLDEEGMWFRYEDNIYSIPSRYFNVTDTGWIIRQDWLDNLGLSMPTTIDDLTEVARQFTFNDPDQNGADDTVAFGALDTYQFYFGFALGAYGGVYDWREEDGVYLPWHMRDDVMLPALELAREWYQMGVVEPDLGIISRNDTLEKRNQNTYGIENYYLTQLGMATPWWPAFVQAVPEQETTYLPVISAEGYEGKYPTVINANVGSSKMQLYLFSGNRNPERCIQLIDYFATDEGSDLVYLGPQGITWDLDDNGDYYKIEMSDEEYAKSGAQLYHSVFMHEVYHRSADPVVIAAAEHFTQYMERSNIFPYVYTGDSTSLDNIVSTHILSIIKDGNINVEEAYVQMKQEYLTMGGQEYIDWYNEMIGL